MSSQKVPLVFVHERVYCRIVTILSDQRLLNNSVWTHGYDFFFFATFDDPFRNDHAPPMFCWQPSCIIPPADSVIYQKSDIHCHGILMIPVNGPLHIMRVMYP